MYDTANKQNRPPVLALPAHTAPLGIEFYKRVDACDRIEGAFPCSALDDAFVTFHSQEYVVENSNFLGDNVSWLPINSTTQEPTGEYIFVLYELGLIDGSCDRSCKGPVNAVFDHKGHMMISFDWNGEIYRVTYGTPPPPISAWMKLY
jgi:glucose/arabinose dehydrogenase